MGRRRLVKRVACQCGDGRQDGRVDAMCACMDGGDNGNGRQGNEDRVSKNHICQHILCCHIMRREAVIKTSFGFARCFRIVSDPVETTLDATVRSTQISSFVIDV